MAKSYFNVKLELNFDHEDGVFTEQQAFQRAVKELEDKGLLGRMFKVTRMYY